MSSGLRAIVRELCAERNGTRQALSEHDSLRVLAAAGVEVVRSELVRSAADAPALASRIGYPLVLKGLVPNVAHKTERGLVHPWIRSEAELLRAMGELPDDCVSYLLEEQVRGIRELVLGIVRDAAFGPTVLVAMGGVHSELLADTCFVVAPVSATAARAALDRLRCARMLGPYRGEEPAKLDLLVEMMSRLGQLALDCPEVSELDVNPVILRRDGTPIAASGLVVLGGGS